MKNASQDIGLEALLPFMLNKVIKVINSALDRALQEHGMSVAEWRVLATLGFSKIDRPADIAKFTGIDPSTLSRAFDRLEAQGYVERSRPPGSRRGYSMSLTTLGRSVLRRAIKIVRTQHDELLQLMDKQQAKHFLKSVAFLYQKMGQPPELAD
ncbi:MAG: hypothetical protein BGP04_07275 [Rhizobiales bacterium 62-17]|nr:MarR family transcriptional regulator [Hyphomicrobiales bacterium]OJY05211.1 MAG: hypothetical protein BGP04_07275 [Rhizobiales bacterium 62-17]